ncbi:MAG: hypothetical protein LBU23_06410, partial [Planctomycetota bacterium]|nr:hypothetical protein [Planctomycetota bacterium]
MRPIALLNRRPLAATLVFLLCRLAPAAMFGEFAVPDNLPGTTALATERTLIVALADGGELTIQLSGAGGQATEPANVLQSIAARLAPDLPVRILDFGGRPWFGNRVELSGGVYLYNGYIQRNSVIHPVAFSLRGACVPDAAALGVLSRLQLLPELVDSPAEDWAIRAADLVARGEIGDLETIVGQLAGLDPLGWAAPFYRGRLAELTGHYAEARDSLALALARWPDDLETAAKYHGAAFLADGDESRVRALYELGESAPDDPAAWEELARIYILADDREAGRSYLEAALAANPASRLALASLANLLAEEGDYAGAFRVSRETLSYWPGAPFEILPDLSNRAKELEPLLPALLSEPQYLGSMAAFTSAPAASASDACAPPPPLPEYVRLAPQAAAGPEQIAVEQPVYIVESPTVYIVKEPAPVYVNPIFSLILDLFGNNSRHRRDWDRGPDRDKRPPAFRPPANPDRPGRPNRPGGSNRPGGPNRPGGQTGGSQPSQPANPGGSRPPRPPMAATRPTPVSDADSAPAAILPAPIQAAPTPVQTLPAAPPTLPIQPAAPAPAPPRQTPPRQAQPKAEAARPTPAPTPPPRQTPPRQAQPKPEAARPTTPAPTPQRQTPPRQAQPKAEAARPTTPA